MSCRCLNKHADNDQRQTMFDRLALNRSGGMWDNQSETGGIFNRIWINAIKKNSIKGIIQIIQ
jgi:hypothetical protein